MKKLIVFALILITASCVSLSGDKYSAAKKQIPAVKKYVITNLEITDQSEINFIKSTTPEMREVNSILYYWFKDSKGNATYTVEANPGKNFYIYRALKN